MDEKKLEVMRGGLWLPVSKDDVKLGETVRIIDADGTYLHVGDDKDITIESPSDLRHALAIAKYNPLAYLNTCKILSTISQEDDYEGWKAARGRGIGGSEIGAICGVSKYASPRTVYLRKTKQYDEDFDDSAKERMLWGRVLEPFVADEFSRRTGKRVEISPATMVHKDFPWAIANIDRFIVDDYGVPYGILECKTASEYLNEDWEEGEIPMSYVYQLQWYLWITGLKYGAFACLVGGNKFHYYEVFINEQMLMEDMIPAASKFWNHNVRNMIEPEIGGSEADSKLIKHLYADVEKGSEKTLDGNADDLARAVKELKAEIKERETKLESVSNQLKEMLKNTEIGYTASYIVKWSPRSQSRIDTDAIKEHYPNVYETCKKQINFRVLTVK